LIGGGQFDAVSIPTPLEVKDSEEKEIKFKDVAMGESICCAVDVNGFGWQWGGTLLVPTLKEKLSDIAFVAAGSHHLSYVSNTGKLFTMGSNWSGQLGVIGSKLQSQDIHEVIIPSKVIHVSCGSDFTLALTKNE
jgi:alpha-tubulin suppressor-like RCC1 family protein